MNQNQNLAGKPVLKTEVGAALSRSRSAFIGIGIFSAFINLLMLTGPLYMLQVYDRVLASRSMSTLVAFTVLMGVMYLFMGFLDYVRGKILVRIGDKLEKDLGPRTFSVWLQQGLFGKAGQRHRPLQDLSVLRQFFSGPAPATFFDIPWVPVFIFVMFIFHPILGYAGVIAAILIFILAWINERTSRIPLQDANAQRQKSDLFAETSHRNADAITAMGMDANMQARWGAVAQEAARDTMIGSDRTGSLTAMSKAFRMFVQSGILGLGAMLAVQQVISPGTMIAASIVMGRALAPIQMALSQWRGFISARQAFRRLNAFYDLMPARAESLELPAPAGRVTAENVLAGPPGSQTPVLAGINFTLAPGQALAVIGPSAAGKSTLARLLVGIWMPQKGSVRLDGAAFDQYSRAQVGPYLGYLPQDVELFDGTIGENIARFTPDAKAEDIVQATQRAGVHDMILRFEGGYDTRIGEGGAVLSSGQNQRVALARALFGDPALVVLDEPNSNLDTEGDAALAAAILDLKARGKTVVVMTHRPSTLQAVDLLLVLKEGRQIGFGPKDEVIAEMRKTQGTDGAPAAAPSSAPPNRKSVNMRSFSGTPTGGGT